MAIAFLSFFPAASIHAYQISTFGDYRIIVGVESSEAYAVKVNQIQDGYSPVFVDAFMHNYEMLYCFIWKKDDGIERVLTLEQEWMDVYFRLISDSEAYNYPLQIDTVTISEDIDVEVLNGVDFLGEHYTNGYPRFSAIWTKSDGQPERFVTHLRRNPNGPASIGQVGYYSFPPVDFTHQEYFDAVKEHYVPISRCHSYPTWLNNTGSTSTIITMECMTEPWVTTIYQLGDTGFSAKSTLDFEEFSEMTDNKEAGGYKLKYVDVQTEMQQSEWLVNTQPLFKGGLGPSGLTGFWSPNAFSPIYRKDSRDHHVQKANDQWLVGDAHEAGFNLGMRPISIAGFRRVWGVTDEPQYCIVFMDDRYVVDGDSGNGNLKPDSYPQEWPDHNDPRDDGREDPVDPKPASNLDHDSNDGLDPIGR